MAKIREEVDVMKWYMACLSPKFEVDIDSFPFYVGRIAGPTPNCAIVDDPVLSNMQFALEKRFGGVYYVNYSNAKIGILDGMAVTKSARLSPDKVHVLKLSDITIAIGRDRESTSKAALAYAVDLYMVSVNGREVGPFTETQLLDGCEKGYFTQTTRMHTLKDPDTDLVMADVVDFEDKPEERCVSVDKSAVRTRMVTVEERQAELGESFTCPYCRTVSDLEDVLAVSVSPGLVGDPVLGEGEQKRFLPSQFTGNGLAIDSEGGVCTETACPRCHMTLPRTLLDTPQIVMSVVGAVGAGKSVFLASAIWQCRQMLKRLFDVNFMDLDPVANRWINAYEERLFFQQDDMSLQQIEKTDLQASNVSRTVLLDGDNVLLPLPGFFSVQAAESGKQQNLVVYDSAGEHFRAGADTQGSSVTLNMLNADTLFFMFDPSADPCFHSMLDVGRGTAHNYAQRQDTLLSEMVARIKRHLGNRGEAQISRPVVLGVSKSDLLRRHLPLDVRIYKGDAPGRYVLDVDALREVSNATETFLHSVVPVVTNTVRHIASDAWFIPISSLGHNPMREGVRPCDIKPIWVELPIVFTLAKKGLIPIKGSW